jgi:transposase-like protein
MNHKAYSPEIRREILKKIQAGQTVAAVAAQHGIKENTIRNWLVRDTAGHSGELLELSRLRREKEELLRLVGMLTYQSESEKKNSCRVRKH